MKTFFINIFTSQVTYFTSSKQTIVLLAEWI